MDQITSENPPAAHDEENAHTVVGDEGNDRSHTNELVRWKFSAPSGPTSTATSRFPPEIREKGFAEQYTKFLFDS